MKKILVLFMLFITYSFAIDQAAAIEAVKANPALLNTPQAQKILSEKGISKSQVLQKLNGDKTAQPVSQEKIENKIKTTETTKKTTNKLKITGTIVNNPLTYIPEQKLVKLIQSKRQISKETSLKRFGEKFFYNRNKLNTENLAVPDYYQVNIGDAINIQIFGGNDKTLTSTIDNKGNITLPIIGPINVAGDSVAQIKDLIKSKLKPSYPNSKIVVNVKVNSFLQVNLTGFVKAPGVYNLNSLSTVKDLLIAANGFGKLGSMRDVYLKRNGKLLKIIDFYKLIKNGKLVDTTILRNGDIIFVPKAKRLVNLSGDVATPAIYEMKKNETLKDLVSFGGGLLPDASDKSIKITRFVNNSYVKVIFRNLNDKFSFLNGDKVYVYKISQLNHNYIKVYGNIEKPGTYELPKDHKLSTLLTKLTFMKDTYYKYGAIVTFDNHIISFSLKNPKDITLHKKDEVFIFNKYEIEPEKSVQISGTVVKNPGKYRYFKGETLKDAINNAGLKSPFDETKVQIVSYDKRMQPLLKFVNYKNNPDYKLKPLDEITLFDYYNFNPLKPITVMGAVNNPNIFTYAKDLTLKDALTMAGWFKDKADKNYIELIRYQIINNERVRSIKKLSVKDLDFTLKPYDELYVKTIPNWYKKETVTIKGEVKYPGVYVIQKGERLADVIKRAGGFTRDSYLYGAVFTRESVRKMQQDRINKMIYKLKKKVAIISASAKGAGERSINAQNLMTAIDSIAIQAQKLKPIGRIVINLNKNLNKFEKSDYNIKLENGDELYIPSKKDSVIVLGEVLTPSAFVYTTDNSLDYIQKAGGETSLGGDKYFVVHANGITEQADLGSWFSSNINVKPGDAITVPIHIQTSTFYGIAKDVASIVYQLAVTAASLKTVGAL